MSSPARFSWFSSNKDDLKKQEQLTKNNEFVGTVDETVLKEDYVSVKDDSERALIGSIDQGTSSTRFLVFTKQGRIVASAQLEHTQIFRPGEGKVGWHEHDPMEIWENTVQCMDAACKALEKAGLQLTGEKRDKLAAIGITNQRETTVAWDRDTGLPYHNAIVWDDLRTTTIASEIAAGDIDKFRDRTGLPVASYFAGTKVKWLLDNVDALRDDIQDPDKRHRVAFGTIDSWLLYQLTGTARAKIGSAGNKGGIFVTDVTNASRWLFMDLNTTSWDQNLVDAVCEPHSVPVTTALPKICPSGHVFGTVNAAACGVHAAFQDVPLAAVLGDQQAALFGQAAFDAGQAKNTYGTGLFLMMNTGTTAVKSSHGLLTTVAYQLGGGGDNNDRPVQYALEGSVSHAGSTIQWLRDQLKIITEAAESETKAAETAHNDGLYFVPAFAGLFAPHWRDDARACIVGMTASHAAGHVCRAALEAAAYQTREVFEAIEADSAIRLGRLAVDGGQTKNGLLMQFQADMLSVPVVKPAVTETTAMGAAFCAGLTVGVYKDVQQVRQLWSIDQTWNPSMEYDERDRYWKGWKKAVSKSLGWIEKERPPLPVPVPVPLAGGGISSDDDDETENFVDAMAAPPPPTPKPADKKAVAAAAATEASSEEEGNEAAGAAAEAEAEAADAEAPAASSEKQGEEEAAAANAAAAAPALSEEKGTTTTTTTTTATVVRDRTDAAVTVSSSNCSSGAPASDDNNKTGGSASGFGILSLTLVAMAAAGAGYLLGQKAPRRKA